MSGSGGQCPIDHKHMSKEKLNGLMATLGREAPANSHQPPSCPDSGAPSAMPERTCPVDHRNLTREEIAAYMPKRKPPAIPSSSTPVTAASPPSHTNETVYDVYGQEIDPANMMPSTPNQLPSPGQRQPLSTERDTSSIPKAGTTPGTTWTYPSQQMFFNALQRKGKADDVSESDMASVVAIHNNMNERTWAEVLDWERRFHCAECAEPKLRRFVGRPHDLSPAARFRTLFRGYPRPFDRHDWTVDRCGERDVRYVIDYYYRESGGEEPIELHVRPAIDSFSAAFDRARYGLAQCREAITRAGVAPPTPSRAVSAAPAVAAAQSAASAPSQTADVAIHPDEFKFLTSLTVEKVEKVALDVQHDCVAVGKLLADCGNDKDKCEQANVALNYCMATKICPPQAKAFMLAMEGNPGSEAETYGKMASCLERFHIMARRVTMQAAGIAQSGPER